jgi:hypothetical protein
LGINRIGDNRHPKGKPNGGSNPLLVGPTKPHFGHSIYISDWNVLHLLNR